VTVDLDGVIADRVGPASTSFPDVTAQPWSPK
jgi:hypothetical protein